MSKNKLFKMILPAVLFAMALISWKFNNDAVNAKNLNSPNISFIRCSESYFKPEGDNRMWHVINHYSLQNENDTLDCNNSVCFITKDSVLIINDYIGVK